MPRKPAGPRFLVAQRHLLAGAVPPAARVWGARAAGSVAFCLLRVSETETVSQCRCFPALRRPTQTRRADCELPHAAPWSVCASFPSSTSFALEMPPENSPAWPFTLQGTSVTDGSQAPPPLLRRSQRHLCALPRSVPLHPPAADRAHAPSCPREPRRDVENW